MFRKLLLPAMLGAAAAPALAAPSNIGSMTVFGSTAARLCFEAADSEKPSSVLLISECDRALREGGLTPHETVATLVNRGILYLRDGNTAKAMADYDAAIARDPKEAEAYLNKGAALMRHPADAAGALPLFEAALQHGTSKPALAYYGRGLAYELLGNLKSAYLDYKRAAELEPDWSLPRDELVRFTVRAQ